MDNVRLGDAVLLLWNHADENTLQNLSDALERRSKTGKLKLENTTRITKWPKPSPSFNIIVSNFDAPYTAQHSDEFLATIVKLLKPSGKLILKDNKDLSSALKLNGFVNVSKDSEGNYIAEKPNFEVGSKASLKLNGKVKPAVWKLDDDDTVEAAWAGANDDDIIDDNQLLDEDDLKKPNQESLRVCASTGKRKACADCSCGLAEELAGEVKDTPKSSCGSCYLGDAFRCATCPYLGMPAFKPGEKVMLDLNSDV